MVPLFYYNLYYKKEVEMLAYISFISDVYKSYRVEKIVFHHLIAIFTYQD